MDGHYGFDDDQLREVGRVVVSVARLEQFVAALVHFLDPTKDLLALGGTAGAARRELERLAHSMPELRPTVDQVDDVIRARNRLMHDATGAQQVQEDRSLKAGIIGTGRNNRGQFAPLPTSDELRQLSVSADNAAASCGQQCTVLDRG